jgi:manganese-dependent ADP-ribose/CDP-alcohol diphosphatase
VLRALGFQFRFRLLLLLRVPALLAACVLRACCVSRGNAAHRRSIPGCAQSGASYYHFSPHPGFRVVMLDSYDVSLLGWPEAHPHHAAAAALLAARNPNANKNSPEGLEGLGRRFVAFGGGVSDAQLAWLGGALRDAAAAGERVFVCGHLPLHPETTQPVCLLWNYDAVLRLLQASRCVVATLAGHTHREGYHCDDAGVHHRVLASVLECPPGTNAFGHVDVWAHGARLRGTDRMEATHLPFRALQAHTEELAAGLAGLAVDAS